MLKLIKVTGNSLSPFFLSGDYVLIKTYRPAFKNIQSGSTIVFNHPDYGLLIKRVLANHPDSEALQVAGNHEDSISSQKLGLIPYSHISGIVIFHIKKPRIQI